MKPNKRENITKKRSSSRARFYAAIHIAKKELALSEDNYRALLSGATGKESLKLMSDKELEAVIERFKKFGWKKKSPKRAGKRKKADQEHANLIRALWISLYHLGEVRDPSEEAMSAYVKRMCKVDDMQWLTDKQAHAAIAGLRDWMKRAGFIRPTKKDFPLFVHYQATRRHDNQDTSININAAHVFMAQAKIVFENVNDYRSWLAENDLPGLDHPYELSAEEIYSLTEQLGLEVRRIKSSNG